MKRATTAKSLKKRLLTEGRGYAWLYPVELHLRLHFAAELYGQSTP